MTRYSMVCCDLCGTEDVTPAEGWVVDVWPTDPEPVDLCPSCTRDVAPVTARKHQALGICWCGRSHPIPEAIELNTRGETP